ncbi:hypothetical protein EPN96_03350 [bacterium]|nr:MAG: hypothetical protein EPN96_03350 [bacterium]
MDSLKAISESDPPATGKRRIDELLEEVSENCVECGLCVSECSFLEAYGTPRSIAKSYDPSSSSSHSLPFECSLCSLCTAVCPYGVKPKELFLEMRREAIRRGAAPEKQHRALTGYEKAGTSRLLTWRGLPEGCDTVFFPGCALPGTRPGTTFDTFRKLRETIPSLGVVLDCCTKPSHDLGREEYFSATFGELKGWLLDRGVKRVLVACPNCWKVFTDYMPEVAVETVYEALPREERSVLEGVNVTIHDSCVMRFAGDAQSAVRALAGSTGAKVVEMVHSGEKTLCCGEGGAVGYVAPKLASTWGLKRAKEAGELPVVTFCAGCANHLSSRIKVCHVLDLISGPKETLEGKVRVGKSPFTYLNRLRLKARFKKEVKTAHSGERPPLPGTSGSKLKLLLGVAALVALVIGVRASGLGQYLEQERLRELIAGFGVWAPALYMLFYTLAPSLFLPGLPITIVGGILFGPVWGVIYTITSATAGACLAFLVSRYLARDWVEARLTGPRWRKLDEEVAKNGWKVVAFTRLVPLFPFNLLNYALGLTKIGFLPYAAASFVCMLPATIAYIVFSSSLLDLLRGKASLGLIAGIALVAAVSFLPAIVKKFLRRKGADETILK